jgi:oxygen-independent coproporphyrinogen-3 oxidase
VGAGAASFTGRVFAVNHFGLRQYLDAVAAGRLPVALLATLPAPAAAAYRAFWQGYTGAFGPSGDPLLRTAWVRSAVQAARAIGLLAPGPDGSSVMTPRGYDTYHDVERLITYRLIEPLWEHMMAEHQAA